MRMTRKYVSQLRRIDAEMLDQHIGEKVAELDRRSHVSP